MDTKIITFENIQLLLTIKFSKSHLQIPIYLRKFPLYLKIEFNPFFKSKVRPVMHARLTKEHDHNTFHNG